MSARVFRADYMATAPSQWSYVRGGDGEVIEFARYVVDESGRSVLRLDRSAREAIDKSTGFLRGMISVTRTGVFRYPQQDGSVRLELRSPDEVFSPDHMGSIKMAPVTDGHPSSSDGSPTDVTSQNVAQLQRGHLGSNVTRDSSGEYERISSDILITSRSVIDSMIKNDRFENSLGYTASLELADGVFSGPRGDESYNAIQRSMIVNHDAVNVHGRAGSTVRVHVTADEHERGLNGHRTYHHSISSGPSPATERGQMDPVSNTLITLDSTQIAVPSASAMQIQSAFDRLQKLHDDASGKLLVAKADATKAVDELKKVADELKTLKAAIPVKTDAVVMIGILDDARSAGVTFDADKRDAVLALTATDARSRILTVLNADLGKSLEGKTDDYVAATFDAEIRRVKNSPRTRDDESSGSALFAAIVGADTRTSGHQSSGLSSAIDSVFDD